MFLDIFAWIVLVILVASAIAIFFIAGSLPGHIARSRGHPWAQAVTVAGWITLICGFALRPVALIGPWPYCRYLVLPIQRAVWNMLPIRPTPSPSFTKSLHYRRA